MKAIQGNKVIPGVLDHYLARIGYEAQQTDQPVSPSRPDNLFEPLPGDHGEHGIFDNKASGSSAQLWETTHRSQLGIGVAALAGLAVFLSMWQRL